ncbi:MAG: hypothetical protein ABI679_14795 [Gemmatimonadota bacterium]
MLSLADRRPAEWTLRAIALGCLAWLSVGAAGSPAMIDTSVFPGPSVLARLPDWSREQPAARIEIWFRDAPTPPVRDWLVAIRRAGASVAWIDSGVSSVTLDIESPADPMGGTVARVSALPGSRAVLSDRLGPVDTLTIGPLGNTVRLPPLAGNIAVRVNGTSATESPARPLERRHIALLGRAGWESKFIARVLEERGWSVDSRAGLAPGLFAETGDPFPLDTATHAAVIVLDSTANRFAGVIASFLRAGGGVILVGTPPSALRTVAPGSGTIRFRAGALNFPDADPRSGLEFISLGPIAPNATALELRGDRIAVAARRVGSGRILQVGYDETWRWRMEGGPDAVAAHRAWWASLVASVAYRSPVSPNAHVDPAPRSSLIRALGAPSSLVPSRSRSPRYPWVLAIMTLCLLLEWTSRRLRGAA